MCIMKMTLCYGYVQDEDALFAKYDDMHDDDVFVKILCA